MTPRHATQLAEALPRHDWQMGGVRMSTTPRTDAEIRREPLPDSFAQSFNQMTAFARKLELENAAMRVAIEFYANRENWNAISTGIGYYPGPAFDYGHTARVAIEAADSKEKKLTPEK